MGSENPSTEYIESAKVTSQHLLTIPAKVQDLIFPEDIKTEAKVYYWYLHKAKNEEYIYISNHTPREENSKTIDDTKAHSGSSNRTSIPEEIKNKKGIREEDMLYFFAHDETKKSENPSVAIFTEDQMTSKLNLGIESDSDSDALFRPFTKATPSINEQNSIDFDIVSDE